MKDSTTKNKQNRFFTLIITALFWLAVWQIFAMLVNQQLFLASPVSVIAALIGLLGQTAFYTALLNTFLHITLGFVLAFVLGLLLAALSAWLSIAKKLLHPLMTVINSTPVASFTILALILVGSQHISTLMSFLMVMPIIYTNTLSGITTIARAKFEAADIFGMPRGERLRYIYLPETLPHVVSACSVGLGISWKAGVAAEVIGITARSIGGKLYDAKISLATAELFAYTFAIIIVSLLSEKLFVLLLKQTSKTLLD